MSHQAKKAVAANDVEGPVGRFQRQPASDAVSRKMDNVPAVRVAENPCQPFACDPVLYEGEPDVEARVDGHLPKQPFEVSPFVTQAQGVLADREGEYAKNPDGGFDEKSVRRTGPGAGYLICEDDVAYRDGASVVPCKLKWQRRKVSGGRGQNNIYGR
jgi:hypothetical protein